MDERTPLNVYSRWEETLAVSRYRAKRLSFNDVPPSSGQTCIPGVYSERTPQETNIFMARYVFRGAVICLVALDAVSTAACQEQAHIALGKNSALGSLCL